MENYSNFLKDDFNVLGLIFECVFGWFVLSPYLKMGTKEHDGEQIKFCCVNSKVDHFLNLIKAYLFKNYM